MTYREEYERWLASDVLSAQEKEELRSIAGDEKEIENRFYGPLEFGTAGLRGIMGVGWHNMNIHIIRHATQAFAEVILEEGEQQAARGVAIDFDCRNHSHEFAMAAAEVMAANGIPVRIFDSLRPTPELSFAVREYDCIAGINVTASHNPAAYNGYKVYWAGGAQLPPKHAAKIAAKMEQIDLFAGIRRMEFYEAEQQGLITIMSEDTDERFLARVLNISVDEDCVRNNEKFTMVYTPFHGCGYKLIPEVLHRIGLKNLHCEPKQMVIDGNFPTVESPNPENPEGFYLAVDLADQVNADFILGSDPDADRVGLMVRNDEGKFIPLSGNQTGALFLDYYIQALKRAGRLPEHPVALKTIVSTDLVKTIAETNGVEIFNTFTGFKFMAEKKNQLEWDKQGEVIWAFEESYGYMVGDYVRDKDAVTAAMLLTEMACWHSAQGKTVYQALQDLYEKYGAYQEHTLNLVMPGLDGLEKMADLMKELREQAPKEIGGTKVAQYRDYRDGSIRNADGSEGGTMELKGSNVLEFNLENGSKILVRPSGTEPKVKVYLLVHSDTMEQAKKDLAAYNEWAEGLRR